MIRSTTRRTCTNAYATLPAVLAVMAIVTLLGGCRSQDQNQSTPAPAASPEQASQLRAKLLSERPDALVGEVVDVLPASQLCAVGNVDVSKARVGQTVVFQAREPVATGQVLRIVNDRLHVRYEPYGPHGRAPKRGDLAVHLPETPLNPQ